MKLSKAQKEQVLAWIAEGLQSDEMNAKAKKQKPSFKVTRQQVDFYRKSRAVPLKKIIAEDESSALTSGYALRERRVAKLNALAERIWEDLMGAGNDAKGLWLPQRKGVGSGVNAEVFDYFDFNKGEIEAYTAVLDDIARELGHRKIVVSNDWKDELGKMGLDVNKVFEKLVNIIAAGLDESDDGGGAGRGEGAGGEPKDGPQV